MLRELETGRLTLLNQSLPFRGGADWKMRPSAYQNSLWTYTLHYHEWIYRLLDPAAANATLGAVMASKFLQDWIVSCPPGRAGFAHYPWNSFAIACRLQWWARIYWNAPVSFWAAGPDSFRRDFLDSFAMQAQYLAMHIEWDVRGNHLMRDAAGLAFAGTFLPDVLGRRYLDVAAKLADSQVTEQILNDDTHFERSASYQCHFMEDLSHLCVLLPFSSVRSRLQERLRQLLHTLAWLVHPDLLPVQFNDAALNSYAPPASLMAAGRALGMKGLPDLYVRSHGVRHFKAFGIVAAHRGSDTLFFDVGKVGVDYQPGHAHADTLSIEMSIASRRFIVDPGCFDYDYGVNREYDRSSLAHNTVTVNGTNSSELWHVFRVGARAVATVHEFTDNCRGGFTCSASHDGYRTQRGHPIHRRTVSWREEKMIRIVDEVYGNGMHTVQGGFLVAPDWRVVEVPGGFTASLSEVTARIRIIAESPVVQQFIEQGCYHPEFGLELRATRVGWRGTTQIPLKITTLIDWR
jgi:uncharacterized heparinase superfamily protein